MSLLLYFLQLARICCFNFNQFNVKIYTTVKLSCINQIQKFARLQVHLGAGASSGRVVPNLWHLAHQMARGQCAASKWLINVATPAALHNSLTEWTAIRPDPVMSVVILRANGAVRLHFVAIRSLRGNRTGTAAWLEDFYSNLSYLK